MVYLNIDAAAWLNGLNDGRASEFISIDNVDKEKIDIHLNIIHE